MQNIDEKVKQNRDVIMSLVSQPFNVEQTYAEIKSTATDIKRSCGAKAVSTFGLFPPHKDVNILFVKKNGGHLTKSEINNDFVYYFDAQGRIILTEYYNVETVLDNPLVQIIFFEYEGNEINIRLFDKHLQKLQFVGKCVLDETGRLVKYLTSHDYERFVYTELLYHYDDDNIHISEIMYNDESYALAKSTVEREWLFQNKKLVETAQVRRLVFRNGQWTEATSMMEMLKNYKP